MLPGLTLGGEAQNMWARMPGDRAGALGSLRTAASEEYSLN